MSFDYPLLDSFDILFHHEVSLCKLAVSSQSMIFALIFSPLLVLTAANNKANMEKHDIVPKVIDVAPKETIHVTYSGELKVNDGNELTPTQVKDEPSVTWEADSKSLYTLVMTDPLHLLGNPNTNFEILHWLIGNIPGNDLKKGDLVASYVGSLPPEGSGLHKYIFLVYQQKGKIDYDESLNPDRPGGTRAQFFVRKLVEKYKLGNPVAGNFFQAQFDENVPKLRAARAK